MTATTSTPALDPLAAAWLAGGLPRAVDALLVARLEARRIAVVDGHVVDRGLRREDPLDLCLLDALGARGRRDLETVRWRLTRDRRLGALRTGLQDEGLLGRRTGLGVPDRDDRPARTATGRRVLRELRSAPLGSGAWEVALHGRAALTDLALRTALEPPPRPEPEVHRATSWRRSWTRDPQATEAHRYAAGGAGVMAFGGGGGFDGGGGCGGGDGGGC